MKKEKGIKFEDEEDKKEIKLPKQPKMLSPEDTKKIINMIAAEFVKEKKNKLNNLA